ncbi:extracellular solute-binding protein [Clostridiales bacterium FE2011]|nr:extracellular solute-binding protein [Clostridiales bacterium FE2011]
MLCSLFPITAVGETNEEKILHIGIGREGCEYNFAVEKLFLEQNPDWTIVYHLLDPEQLSVQMLSGMSGLDLLIVSYQEMLYLAYQDALVDLEEEHIFDYWPETLLPMRKLHEINNHVYALPHTAEYFQWIWNQDVANLLQCSKPEEPYTWDEFATLLADPQYDLDNDGNRELGLIIGSSHEQLNGAFIPDMIELYISSCAEPLGGFQTDLFKCLIDSFIAFWSSETVMSYNQIPLLGDDMGTLITCFSPLTDIIWQAEVEETNASYLLPPVIDKENPRYLAFYQVWCMPKTDQIKEETKQFLQLLVSDIGQAAYTDPQTCFAKEWPAEIIMDPNMLSTFDHFSPNEMGELTWEVTLENTNHYLTIASPVFYNGNVRLQTIENIQKFHQYLCPYLSNTTELWKVFYSNIGYYKDGQMSFDELAEKLNTIWDMMINE